MSWKQQIEFNLEHAKPFLPAKIIGFFSELFAMIHKNSTRIQGREHLKYNDKQISIICIMKWDAKFRLFILCVLGKKAAGALRSEQFVIAISTRQWKGYREKTLHWTEIVWFDETQK